MSPKIHHPADFTSAENFYVRRVLDRPSALRTLNPQAGCKIQACYRVQHGTQVKLPDYEPPVMLKVTVASTIS